MMESEIDNEFRSGLIDMKSYLKKKRSHMRLKAIINPPEKFARIEDKNDERFHLTPEQLEWFFPASKDKPDWTYEGDYIDFANEQDVAYLNKTFPTVYPGPSYFHKEELPYLLSLDTPLRDPPIHFIRK